MVTIYHKLAWIVILAASIAHAEKNRVTVTYWVELTTFEGKTVNYSPINGKWVMIVYRVQNNSDQPMSDMFSISLVDSNGKVYSPISSLNAMWINEIRSSIEGKYKFCSPFPRINPGDYGEFFVVFDVQSSVIPKFMRFEIMFDRDFKLDIELD